MESFHLYNLIVFFFRFIRKKYDFHAREKAEKVICKCLATPNVTYLPPRMAHSFYTLYPRAEEKKNLDGTKLVIKTEKNGNNKKNMNFIFDKTFQIVQAAAVAAGWLCEKNCHHVEKCALFY